MGKSTPKTMRFDDDVENYIDNQNGNNFSEKFHNLVRYFKDSEIEKKQIIANLDKEIKEKEKRLKHLNDKISNVGWLESTFTQLENSIKSVNRALDNVIQK